MCVCAYVFLCYLCIFVFLQYLDTVGWVFRPVNHLPDNLYCVGGDVKHCSINACVVTRHNAVINHWWNHCTGDLSTDDASTEWSLLPINCSVKFNFGKWNLQTVLLQASFSSDESQSSVDAAIPAYTSSRHKSRHIVHSCFSTVAMFPLRSLQHQSINQSLWLWSLGFIAKIIQSLSTVAKFVEVFIAAHKDYECVRSFFKI